MLVVTSTYLYTVIFMFHLPYMDVYLTLLTYPLLIFQQLCPFNRDKISSFLIRVLKFHDFYLDNTIDKMA